jgi:uncharacterized phage-associated protein
LIPYQKEKIENAICFFAFEHREKSGKTLTQTYLYKYLAFLDFLSVEKLGIPAFDLEYKAMKRGPVPIAIYNNRDQLKTDLYEFKKDESVYYVVPKRRPNLEYFSDVEIALMNRLIKLHARKHCSTDDICEHSHRRITAWKKTFDKQQNDTIDFLDVFKDDIKKKNEEDLTQIEKSYLTFLTLKSAAKCR